MMTLRGTCCSFWTLAMVVSDYSADLQVAETHQDTINLHQERQGRRRQVQVQVLRWWSRLKWVTLKLNRHFVCKKTPQSTCEALLCWTRQNRSKTYTTPQINDWLFITHLLLESLLLLEVRHSSWENQHTRISLIQLLPWIWAATSHCLRSDKS